MRTQLASESVQARSSWRTALVVAALAGLMACSPPQEQLSPLPIPLGYQGGLLFSAGEVRPNPNQLCDGEQSSEPLAPQRILVELGVPLSSMAAEEDREPRSYVHAQVQLNASSPDGRPGTPRFLLCDQRLVRGDLLKEKLFLSRHAPGMTEVSTGPLIAVLGGDLFGRFALTLDFAQDQPTLAIRYPDIVPACLLDDVVLPFRPLGGQIQVKISDEVVTYSASRVTLAACVEPAADPLRLLPNGNFADSCLDGQKLLEAQKDVEAELAKALVAQPLDQTRIQQLRSQLEAATALVTPDCVSPPDLEALGDLVTDHALRRPGFVASGADMRFLVSTATPDFLLSETACRRLGGAETRCSCAETAKVALRLPGLNAAEASGGAGDLVERGCPIKLGGGGRAALALVARQAHLPPCAELARSRRQRWSLPSFMLTPPPENTCLKEGCLENLLRSSSQAIRRCGFSGIDANRACDDHDAPVAGYLELGGPPNDLAAAAGQEDTVEALVVPDSARVLQAANADIRNTSAQIDGVLGISLLQRLRTTVDYPAGRVVVSCRCDQPITTTCRAYRGVSYFQADGCTSNSTLVIPENFGRTICR